MTRKEMLALLNAPDLEKDLPEVARLKGVPQPQEFHAEGDVFIHTRLVIEALAPDAGASLVWAAALHDIGKADTTQFVDGRWRAHGHDIRSAELVPSAMKRFAREDLVDDVVWLVRHHLFPTSWQPAKREMLTARQRRFTRHPLFFQLVALCRADAAGSIGLSQKRSDLDLLLHQLKLED